MLVYAWTLTSSDEWSRGSKGGLGPIDAARPLPPPYLDICPSCGQYLHPPSPLSPHLDICPSCGQELLDDVGAVSADCAGVVLIVLGGYVVNLAEETLHTAALKEEEGEAKQGGE